ncbi:hypothetical protein Q7P37_000180 [Cladosporium fusiforme]
MDVSATPVVRGEFVYHDILLVDIGGSLKRHPRASQPELKTLLDGKAPKDQVAHFYEAQLIHYGLQRSKDKNTAKVHLQQALSQKKLSVPSHITDMEEQMKKEFATNVRKARIAASKALKGTESSVATPASKKRKQGSEGTGQTPATNKKTKVTMRIGDVEVSIDHNTVETTSQKKKQQTTPAKPTKPQSSSKEKSTTKARPTNPQPVTKTKTPQTPRQSPSKPSAQTPKTNSQPRIKNEPLSNTKSPAKKTPHIKREVKQEPDTEDDAFTTRYITGVYNISCPQLSSQTATSHLLRLSVDNESGKIWGSFSLVTTSGVLLIADSNADPDVSHSFGWRARDADSGRLSFGRGCFGEIVFFGERQVRGTFFNLFPAPVDFEGERRAGLLWCGSSTAQLEGEWDGYVKEAYGR